MTVAEYRKNHRRCRTCKHACNHWTYGSMCKAKNARRSTRVEDLWLRGMFCKVYEPKECENNV